jgi:hypothetical protein
MEIAANKLSITSAVHAAMEMPLILVARRVNQVTFTVPGLNVRGKRRTEQTQIKKTCSKKAREIIRCDL